VDGVVEERSVGSMEDNDDIFIFVGTFEVSFDVTKGESEGDNDKSRIVGVAFKGGDDGRREEFSEGEKDGAAEG
jgi:hypothetical protein